MRSPRPLTLAFLTLAACGSSDSRCNAQNCQAILSCHETLQGADDVFFCAPSFPTADFFDAGIDACIQACQTQNQGALLACVGSNFTQSSCQQIQMDAGPNAIETAIETLCEPGGVPACGTNCQTCRQTCSQANTSCETPCITAADAGACFSCSYNCAQANVSCTQGCPTD